MAVAKRWREGCGGGSSGESRTQRWWWKNEGNGNIEQWTEWNDEQKTMRGRINNEGGGRTYKGRMQRVTLRPQRRRNENADNESVCDKFRIRVNKRGINDGS